MSLPSPLAYHIRHRQSGLHYDADIGGLLEIVMHVGNTEHCELFLLSNSEYLYTYILTYMYTLLKIPINSFIVIYQYIPICPYYELFPLLG